MRNRIYILLLLWLLASCKMESYTGFTDTSIYESTPILISIGSDANRPGDTRSSGSINTEEIWKWKDSEIFVYSFLCDSLTGFDVCSTDDAESCLVDGAEDGRRNAGRLSIVKDSTSYLLWANNAPCYPSGFDSYDFYAYYIDDCQVADEDIVRGSESITMPVTINGVQDLMTARARPAADHLENNGYTEEQKAALSDAMFSAYTANNGLHPELYFTHHLVKLTFEAYPAREEAKDMTIQEISVETRTDALFTVVHRDSAMVGLDFSGDTDYEYLLLMEKDCQSYLTRDKYRMYWFDNEADLDVYERTAMPLGGSLLVAPESSYVCKILMKGKDLDNIPFEFKITNTDGEFLPGNHYRVRLAVYGKFGVGCAVELIDWEDGGSHDIDVI